MTVGHIEISSGGLKKKSGFCLSGVRDVVGFIVRFLMRIILTSLNYLINLIVVKLDAEVVSFEFLSLW